MGAHLLVSREGTNTSTLITTTTYAALSSRFRQRPSIASLPTRHIR
jgi:hypothetical protein